MVSSSESGGGHGQSQDFDLNLAPIIDCFTVLITFMLASASFLAIGIIDSSVAASGSGAQDQKPPALRVEVELSTKKEISIKVTGKQKLDKKLVAKDNDYDATALVNEVEALKRSWPDTKALVLSAQDDVEYLQVVKMMEALKSHIPVVLLGGL
jgi:biopolymer transport protein ExbD